MKRGEKRLLFTGGSYVSGLGILKRYGDKFKLIVCKNARVAGWENNESGSVEKGSVNDDKLECNIARARSKIFEYAMCNAWEYFCTLTISSKKYDRYNLGAYQKALYKFLNNYQTNNNCKIRYLLIPEQHDDGAWHMHGFFSGIPKEKLIENQYGYLDWSAYSKKFGYISLDKIKNHEACSKYITKYISKDMAKCNRELNAHLYYCSKGLKTAETIKKGLMVAPINPDYENDYVKIKWFDSVDVPSNMILE